MLPGVDLVGAYDPWVDADDLPFPVLADLDAFLGLGLDMAVLATPTSTHLELGLALAAAGVPTMVEKPVAASVEEAYRLACAFRQAGLVGAVGHIERYNPALQEMRRRLDEGQLGEIYQVSTRRIGPFPVRIADVGVVLDLATHDIDLTAWVTRSPYRTVSAQSAHRSGRRHEDLVAAVATLDDGTVANHLVNWLSPLKERITLVTGERGSLAADTLTMDLTFFANGVAPVEWETLQSFRGVVQGDMVRYAIPKPEPLMVELTAFRDAILGEPDRVVSLLEGARVVAVAEAMQESAATGATVTVTDPEN
jgi:predicted dehydrogenase